MLCSYVFLVLTLLMRADAKDQLLTSSYSQVARSGSIAAQARSNQGQTPWTQSSDAHIVRGQNLPTRRKPNRRLSVTNKKITRFEDGTGEVIQERFNPRPWFGYEAAGGKGPGPAYIPPPTDNSNNKPNSDTLTVPFESFPLSLPPSNKDKPSLQLKPPFDNDKTPVGEDSPPVNTYGSPYDSYNPNQTPQSTKPPNNFVTPSVNNEYLPPPEPPKFMTDMESSKYLSPAAPQQPEPDQNESPNDDMDMSPPSVPYKDSPVDDHHHYGSYTPHHHDHPEDYDNQPQPVAPPAENPFPNGLPSYLDHDPNAHGNSFDHHHFPHDHDHDHPPIYYEVKTTTEAPENQRLNKRPYSYYYIGRKLWYIPLYFSVYFIIYVFVLILKSIARHKITFKQYFEEDKREMKDMHEEHDEHVHELDHHVLNGIMTAKRKYIM